jgi:uncharacterized repeat protein (TIGR01451 family)
MKRFSIASLGAIAVMTTIPFVGQMPVSASLFGSAVAQNVQQQSQVQLRLTAQKKVMQKDQAGQLKMTWQPLQGNVVVQPGDVIRYTVTGANNSDRSVKNLAFTQPIPKQTKYVLNSTTAQDKAAKITYSIDNGKTFVANPTVRVKLPDGKVETRPAPAELYTHVRWNFSSAINPQASVNGAYQVQVR